MKPYFKVKKKYTSDIFGYVNLRILNLELDSYISDVTRNIVGSLSNYVIV